MSNNDLYRGSVLDAENARSITMVHNIGKLISIWGVLSIPKGEKVRNLRKVIRVLRVVF